MKKLSGSALRSKGNHVASYRSMHITRLVFCSMLLIGFLIAGCKKQDLPETVENDHSVSSNVLTTDEDFQKKNSRISWRTLWELLQARAATVKYQRIENALKDGYADIGVVVPNMGHHYMRASIVDAKFEVKKPELLVYNKRHDGSFQLVAVEYAVPIDLSPDKAPNGFTGDADVWDRNTGFGLWLLHAWVWYFNPDGVFNPTNPLIHLHDH